MQRASPPKLPDKGHPRNASALESPLRHVSIRHYETGRRFLHHPHGRFHIHRSLRGRLPKNSGGRGLETQFPRLRNQYRRRMGCCNGSRKSLPRSGARQRLPPRMVNRPPRHPLRPRGKHHRQNAARPTRAPRLIATCLIAASLSPKAKGRGNRPRSSASLLYAARAPTVMARAE